MTDQISRRALLGAAAAASPSAAHNAAGGRSNFVVICFDDLGYGVISKALSSYREHLPEQWQNRS